MMTRPSPPWVPATLAVLLFAGAPAHGTTNPVLHWNEVGTRISAEAQTDPISESRIFAILQIAVHNAVNAVEPHYPMYGAAMPASRGASVDAAVAQTSRDVLVALLPARTADFDAALKAALAAIADGPAKSSGIEVGRQAAARILAERSSDGADRKVDYAPGTKPGQYRPTPPDFTPALFPQWGGIRPFALASGDQFRPPPPPDVTGSQARFDMNEVAAVGAMKGSVRTQEQSEIARFWYEYSTRGWNRIARVVAESRNLDAWESARLLALVNIAMADGFIAGMDAKYHYSYWRPETALRETGHKEWLSYLPTPPVPDYPSTHSVLGAAAAAVLVRYCGSDYVSFSTTSGAPYPGITRKFWSFSEAAHENAASRVFAGLHFSTATATGYRLGEAVGTWTFDHALRFADAAAVTTSGGTH
jgi:hypothetical protein